MSIEHTADQAGNAAEEVIQDTAAQLPPTATKGLHHPDYLRASWMDAKVPGTDKVTVGDAMLYAGGVLVVGAVAYGVYRMVKHLTDDNADAALIGGDAVSL